MLSRNFKTALELDIAPSLYNALVKLLGMLERGEIKGLPEDAKVVNTRYFLVDKAIKWIGMQFREQTYNCGAAGCLIGWVEYLDPSLAWVEGHTIHDLFLPKGEALNCNDPEKIAQALSNYLTTGEPRWKEVMQG